MHLPNALGFTPLHAAVMHTTTARAAITNARIEPPASPQTFLLICVSICSQSVSQPVYQSGEQLVSQSDRQSNSWSISRSISQSVGQADNQTVRQTDRQSVSRSVYQVINWSVTRPSACCQVAGESSSAEPMIAMIQWLLRHTGFRSLASSDRYLRDLVTDLMNF